MLGSICVPRIFISVSYYKMVLSKIKIRYADGLNLRECGQYGLEIKCLDDVGLGYVH